MIYKPASQSYNALDFIIFAVYMTYFALKLQPSDIPFLLLETKEKNENFGTSLLLSNSPMSPKIVNGSFAAIYDSNEIFDLRVGLGESPCKYIFY